MTVEADQEIYADSEVVEKNFLKRIFKKTAPREKIGPLGKRRERWFFAQVTPFQVHVKIGHFNTLVWVTDFTSGLPVVDATVKIFRDTYPALPELPAILTRAETDSAGVAMLAGIREIDPALKFIQAYDMADRIRANARGVTDGNYNNLDDTSPTAGDCVNNTCTAAQLATYDYYEWVVSTRQALPAGHGTVSGGGPGTRYTITVMWDEERTGTATRDCDNLTTLHAGSVYTPEQQPGVVARHHMGQFLTEHLHIGDDGLGGSLL